MKDPAMRKSALTVLAAAMLSASIAVPAAAREASVKVYFGDLDLSDPAGAAVLEERIAEAVDQVCAKTEPPRIRGMVAWEQCKALSLADAMEKLAAIKPSPEVALAASSEN
jgi:UrcA family protein